MEIKKYEDFAKQLFKFNGESLAQFSLNVWDPLNFKIEVDGECVYGYQSPTRVSGNQGDFTIHLQFTSPWNMALKDKVGEGVTVHFYYKNNDEYYTMFNQTMRVKDHKLSFEHEIPTVNIRFTTKKENK